MPDQAQCNCEWPGTRPVVMKRRGGARGGMENDGPIILVPLTFWAGRDALEKQWVETTREKLGNPGGLQLLQKTFDRLK